MDLLKLFVESYVQLIGHIAWPVAILIILLIFRKPIIEKLRLLIEASSGDKRVKFLEEGKIDQSAIPTVPAVTETPAELSKEARKILATLWGRQTYHFKDDYSRRWSFRILPNSRVYGIFIVGFAELLKAGLINWEPKDGQAFLTEEGIEYLKEHVEIRESDDVYKTGDV